VVFECSLVNLWHLSSVMIPDASLAFRKRPSDELTMALNVDSVSSGAVLGAGAILCSWTRSHLYPLSSKVQTISRTQFRMSTFEQTNKLIDAWIFFNDEWHW
jgi:hypothetical protein